MAVVLVVEDDRDVNLILERLFTRAGFAVMTAADATAALRLATVSRPDVVVTDLDMPGMNGLQLCEALRADPALSDVPVAILSGSLRRGDPRPAQVRACGAWLKPFNNTDLVAAVRALLDTGPHDHPHDHHRGPSPCPLAP